MQHTHICLKVEHLSYAYDSRQVLRDISFCIKKGEFVGITGSNGAGKSTLVKLILGLLPIQSGRIEFCKDIQADTVDLLGYVSQKSASFNPSFPATVEEVVAANYKPTQGWFVSRQGEAREAVQKVLRRFHIGHLAKQRIGSLSGGEQQKAFIARAMINNPEILFLDEPAAGVDAASSEALYRQLGELNRKEGLTMLMVSHDIASLIKVADRVIHLSRSGEVHSYATKEMDAKIISELYGI